MIKATDLSDRKSNQRIDALAEAMGFSFEDGKYIKTVRTVRKYTRHATPTKVSRRKYKKNAQFASTVYNELAELAVNGTSDITEEVKATGCTLDQAKMRVWAWSSKMRAVHPNFVGHYNAYRIDGRIIATRTK